MVAFLFPSALCLLCLNDKNQDRYLAAGAIKRSMGRVTGGFEINFV